MDFSYDLYSKTETEYHAKKVQEIFKKLYDNGYIYEKIEPQAYCEKCNKFLQDRVKRKAMNSFFCKTDNPFTFDGRINEDVNAYVGLGRTGNLFLTFCDVSLKQKHTQQNKGGMTETYNEGGTYLKSFYTVMANPSCVKICIMGDKYLRIHHRVNWNNAVPKIISDKYKK